MYWLSWQALSSQSRRLGLLRIVVGNVNSACATSELMSATATRAEPTSWLDEAGAFGGRPRPRPLAFGAPLAIGDPTVQTKTYIIKALRAEMTTIITWKYIQPHMYEWYTTFKYTGNVTKDNKCDYAHNSTSIIGNMHRNADWAQNECVHNNEY